MADVRAAADKPADKPVEKTAEAKSRGGSMPAGESSNPEVHHLLAERQNIVDAYDLQSGDDELKAREEQRKKGQQLLDGVDKRLEELGYTAK